VRRSRSGRPFHAILRDFAGPSLLAMILVEEYANHQPLNGMSPKQRLGVRRKDIGERHLRALLQARRGSVVPQ
jgi:transposase